jgi:DNA mismatch endonuclease Vsr
MTRIRGRDTAPAIELRRALHSLGLGFRLHVAALPGKADLVLPRWGAVVFVHGCFWHAHRGCSIANLPQTNIAFWAKKFVANRSRDPLRLVRFEPWACASWLCGNASCLPRKGSRRPLSASRDSCVLVEQRPWWQRDRSPTDVKSPDHPSVELIHPKWDCAAVLRWRRPCNRLPACGLGM